MNYLIKIQYADKNPMDFETIENVDLNKAIKTFEEFDWIKQFRIIENRQFYNLKSSTPSILISKENEIELISIQGYEKREFIINYQKDSKYETYKVSKNFIENLQANSVQDYIISFFNNELEAKVEFDIEESNEEVITIGKFNPKRHFTFLLYFLIPIAVLLMKINENSNSEVSINFLLYSTLFFALILSPNIFLLIHYLSKPKLLKVEYSNKTNLFTLFYVSGKKEIKKGDIKQCTYSYTTKAKLPWSRFANIVITLKNKKHLVLTSLTFEEEDFRIFLQLLQFNYYYFDTPFQKFRKSIISEKIEKIEKIDLESLEEIYSDYSDKQLSEIIENEMEYQEDAVIIVKKIIQERTK